MSDFFTFRRMLTTVVIQIIFWIGHIATIVVGAALVIYGIAGMTDTDIDIDGVLDVSNSGNLTDVFWGVVILVGGPIVVRIACEVVILFFRMNETLTDILNAVGQRPATVTVSETNALTAERIDQAQDRTEEKLDEMQEDLQESLEDVRERVENS